MIKKIPLILLFVIALIAFGHKLLPLHWKGGIFALALCMKSVLVFFLPLLIFALIFKTTAELAKGATHLIILILSFVIISNFCSTFISFEIGKWVHGMDVSLVLPEKKNELSPLWSFSLTPIVSNGKALLCGAALGLTTPFLKPAKKAVLLKAAAWMIDSLLKGFLLIIPVFVAGFVVKLAHDKVLSTIIKDYSKIFLSIAFAQSFYVFLLYNVFNGFRAKKAWLSIRNMLPSACVGFSAMSSAAAMPLSIRAAEKNESKYPEVAKTCIPATVNIHLIGDCLAIPLFAFAVLKNFSMPMPDLMSFSLFALYFVIAKFSVAAIPGGGIIVMLPILEKYLGFSADMLSLITALYILFDPVITFTNVLGNGAFAQGISRIYPFFSKREKIGHKLCFFQSKTESD